MKWYQLYINEIQKKGSLENYVRNKINNKSVLISLINKYSHNNKIIECGSGTGVLSTYLAANGYDVLGLDIDPDMLKLSEKISNEYTSDNKPKFENKSIFELGNVNEFDVSFSNGVLEHFSDEEIIDTLKQQMNIADYVIFSIPTTYFDMEEAMYGNERYLPFSYWRGLVKKAGGIIIEEKSMHYMTLKHRIFNYKKYFRPYPFRIFVIKKK